MALGKVVHWGVDLLLLSTALAGIRRSTGFKFNSGSITDNETARAYIDKYLLFGETAISIAASQMSSYPKYFSKE
ncbi:hypothetical protein H4R22_000509 [Coemansia sp. RSA 1290]|nr:hypothetical protein H4R22_000509 [Coemansia sp. RSA 1290]